MAYLYDDYRDKFHEIEYGPSLLVQRDKRAEKACRAIRRVSPRILNQGNANVVLISNRPIVTNGYGRIGSFEDRD
jgi:hypothetical protein